MCVKLLLLCANLLILCVKLLLHCHQIFLSDFSPHLDLFTHGFVVAIYLVHIGLVHPWLFMSDFSPHWTCSPMAIFV